MFRSNILIITCMIIGTAVLVSLGTWQVQRMYWKKALIERVQQRIEQPAVSLDQLVKSGLSKKDHEYLPVTVAGNFEHEHEVYFFASAPGGGAGWHVHTPIQRSDGSYVIVNRGFVPFELKDAKLRPESIATREAQLVGLLRFPLEEKPFGSVDNAINAREFFWRNVSEMASAMNNPGAFINVIVDARTTGSENTLPRAGTTILAFPNNHLQYAVTWYGLAITLLGVGGYFLLSRRQKQHG